MASHEVPEHVAETSNLLNLLGDATRLRIMLFLAGGDRNVTDICNQLKLPQPTVSHHLGLLRMNKLLQSKRDGKSIRYSFAQGVTADKARISVKVDGLSLGISVNRN